jgi:hypothetical protein
MKRLYLVLAFLLSFQISYVSYGAGPLPQTEGQAYVVQTGDWLSKLADKFYGNPQAWQTIVDAHLEANLLLQKWPRPAVPPTCSRPT